MKRFAIFLLLGPPLAVACIFAGALPSLLSVGFVGAGASGAAITALLFGLLAYLYGTVPALIAAIVDWAMSSRPVLPRIAVTTIAGYIGAALVGVFFSTSKNPVPVDVLTFGLLGAIPAALCSFLSGQTK